MRKYLPENSRNYALDYIVNIVNSLSGQRYQSVIVKLDAEFERLKLQYCQRELSDPQDHNLDDEVL